MLTPATKKLALKALCGTASPIHSLTWELPTHGPNGWTPGALQSVERPVTYGQRGLHVCSSVEVGYWRQLVRRIRPGARPTVWVVEYDGATDVGAHGLAAERVRVLRPWDGKEAI